MLDVALPILLAIDWVLKISTAQRGNGIQWTPWTQVDDLDFADDLALLSHTQRQMQKTSKDADSSVRLGLKVDRGKSKVLKINAAVSTTPPPPPPPGGRWIRRGDQVHLPT